MSINEVPSNKPNAPDNLSEVGDSKPIAPANLTEQGASKPVAPANLTEQSGSLPLAPVNLTKKAKSEPLAPVNLPEVSKRDPLAPSNLTELSASTPSNPVNLTEKPVSKPSAPVNLAELVDAGINRTLTPLFNFNASLGLPDSVTYSRSSSASYIESYQDPLGRSAKRLTNDFAGSVENLSTYSENLNNADWNATNASKVSSSEFTPDNNRNSVKLVANVGNALHSLFNGSVAMVSGNAYTFSVIAKASGLQYLQLSYSSAAHPTNQHANFDLINGVITANVGGVASMKYLSNGWYECSFKEVSNNTNASNCLIILVGTPTATRGSSFVGNGIDGVLIYKAQTTQSSYPLPYVRTFDVPVTEAFTAKPRYEEKGLLVEGASTNLLLRSQELDNSSWSKIGISLNVNARLALDGSFSADKIIPSTVSEGHLLRQDTSLGNGTYTFSIFVKPDGYSAMSLLFNDGVSGSTAWKFDFLTLENERDSSAGGSSFAGTNGYIKEVSSGWFQISLTSTRNTGGGGFLSVRAYPLINYSSDNVSTIYAGNGTSGILIWGAQLEALPFATSYIRTEGSTVSRAAEDIFATIGSLNTEGTLLSEASYLGSTTDIVSGRTTFSLNDNSINNRHFFYNPSGQHSSYLSSFNGSLQQTLNSTIYYEDGQTVSSVVSFGGSIAEYYQDGVLYESTSTYKVPQNIATLLIGQSSQTGTFLLNGHIKRIEVYDLALTANEVKKL
jgi:hypothetical protein